MSIKDYWLAWLDCGCRISLDRASYAGDIVVDGGRISTPCATHGIGQAVAELQNQEDVS